MRPLPAAVLLQCANVGDLTVEVPRQHVHADALPHFENPSQAGFPPVLRFTDPLLLDQRHTCKPISSSANWLRHPPSYLRPLQGTTRPLSICISIEYSASDEHR